MFGVRNVQGTGYMDSDLGRAQRDVEIQLDGARKRLRVETLAGKPRARRIVDELERKLARIKQNRRDRGEEV